MAESNDTSSREPVGAPVRGAAAGRGPSRAAACGLTGLGLVTALVAPLVLTPARFLVLLLFGAFAGSMTMMINRAVSALRAQDPADAVRSVSRAAVVGAVLAVAWGVLVVAFGGNGLAVAVMAGAGFALVRAASHRLARAKHGPGEGAADGAALRPGQVPAQGGGPGLATARAEWLRDERPALPTPPFDHLSTVELAQAWSASRSLLGSASSARMHAEIVTLRALYLDELERRDPVGVQRWLDAGASALTDLLPYLDRDRTEGEPGTTST